MNDKMPYRSVITQKLVKGVLNTWARHGGCIRWKNGIGWRFMESSTSRLFWRMRLLLGLAVLRAEIGLRLLAVRIYGTFRSVSSLPENFGEPSPVKSADGSEREASAERRVTEK
jgi:hypothetical protein